MQSSTIHNTFKLLSWHDSVRQLPSANLAQMNWRVLNDSIQLPGILETQGSQQNTNTKEGLICSVLLILSMTFLYGTGFISVSAQLLVCIFHGL